MEEIMILAEQLQGKTIKMVNSTAMGGGVAEMLHRFIPLCNELGLKVKWEVIKGSGAFFNVTKGFHNALHGKKVDFPGNSFEVYREVNEQNSHQMSFDEDIIVIHDPQPAALIEKKKKSLAKWVWRCHIDTSHPDPKVWDFLETYINKYDASIFSAPSFAKELPIPQYLIYPAIDPFSEKNRELSGTEVSSVLKKFNIPTDKPIITQISRFDYLKDPIGVYETYRLVKKNVDCRFVYAGGTASDDPEGTEVLNKLREKEYKTYKEEEILRNEAEYKGTYLDPAEEMLRKEVTMLLEETTQRLFGVLDSAGYISEKGHVDLYKKQ